MKISEIKKALYREVPIAYLGYIKNGIAHYSCATEAVGDVHFMIPVSDMGEASFTSQMQAKYLIRWIADMSK